MSDNQGFARSTTASPTPLGLEWEYFVRADSPGLGRLPIEIWEPCQIAIEVRSLRSSFRSLDLTDNKIGPNGAISLTETLLPFAFSLTRLCLAGNELGWLEGIGDQINGLQILGNTIVACGCMTDLNISRNFFGHKCALILAGGLLTSTSIQHLSISGNDFEGPEFIFAIGRAIMLTKRLKSLDLSTAILKPDSVNVLAESLALAPSLTKLDLSGNPILGLEGETAKDKDGFKNMMERFASTQTLTSLMLEDCFLGPEGVGTLWAVFPVSITHLSLKRNRIVGAASKEDSLLDGASAIMKTIKAGRNLREVYLDENFIGPKGARIIARGLHSSLRTLSLARNKVAGDLSNPDQPLGIEALTNAIRERAPKLRNLDLTDNPLGPISAAVLLEAARPSRKNGRGETRELGRSRRTRAGASPRNTPLPRN